MAATATSGLGSIFQPNTPSKTAKSNSAFTANSEMYLTLFLTQLKNQDPTQPFDTAQMTEQLAQLNSSQQMIETNKNLETLIAQNKNAQGSQLASFINKEVTYLGDTFYQPVGSAQKFTYINDKPYESVTIQVLDKDNNLVVKFVGNTTQGSHDVAWDGKDALGNPVPAGTYKISAATKDAKGELGNVSTLIKAVVTGVDFSSSKEPVILVGNNENKIGVDLSRIASVMDRPTTTN
jgi:flagellar basal-body rod modification protein FlgD